MNLLFFVAIIGFAMLMATVFPKIRCGTALFSSFLFMLSSSYIMVILLGAYKVFPHILIYGGSLLAVAMLVYGVVKKRLPLVSSSEFWIFIVLSAGLVILLGDGVFISHDNYSFWARAARELYVFKEFYINSDGNITHADYNPIMASLQYCIVAATGWKDASLFYVIIAAVASSLTCLAQTIQGKRKLIWQSIFTALCIIVLPLFSNTFATSFLGADTMLPLFFLAGIMLYFYRDDNELHSLLPIALLAFVLPAVKLYSGALFALCLFAGIFVDQLIANRGKYSDIKFWKKKWLRYPALLLSCVAAMQISWSFTFNYNRAVADTEGRIARNNFAQNIREDVDANLPLSLKYFIKGNPRNTHMLNGVAADGQDVTLAKTIETIKKALSQIKYHKLGGGDLTLIDIVILLVLLFAAIYLFDRSIKKRPLEIATLLTGAAIYTIGVFAAYFVQPATLSGIIRYTSVAIICMAVYVILLLIQRACANPDKTGKINPFIIMCLIVGAFIATNFSIVASIEAYTASQDDTPESISDIDDYISDVLIPTADLEENDRVLIVDAMDWNTWSENGLNSLSIYYYIYEFLPARAAVCSAFDADYSNIGPDLTQKINDTVLYNRSEYVLFTSNDARYISEFHDYFNVPENAVLPWLFSTSVVDGMVVYEYVGQTTDDNNSDNLLTEHEDYSAVWTLEAQNSNSYIQVEVDAGKTYELAVDSINTISGSPQKMDVALYDIKSSRSLYDSYLSVTPLSGSRLYFTTPENMNSENVYLLIYAGASGSTAGNVLELEDLSLREISDKQ